MQNAIKNYMDARSVHYEKKEAERATLEAFRAEQRNAKRDDPEWLETMKALSQKHDAACFAEVRALRIKKAAAYIAERRIKEAAVPVVENLLNKYPGKSAGPKTCVKFCAEVAEEIGNGARVHIARPIYGGKLDRVYIIFSYGPLNDLKVEIYAERREAIVDDNNKFVVPSFAAVDNSNLPDDLEAWADEFERAETALEEAKKAFEKTAADLRRVNLGDACLTAYRIAT